MDIYSVFFVKYYLYVKFNEKKLLKIKKKLNIFNNIIIFNFKYAIRKYHSY